MKTTRKKVCGWREPKKNEKRGDAEYCLSRNQIKYYGIISVEPELLLKKIKKMRGVFDEQMEYKKLQDQAVILIKKDEKLQNILRVESYTQKQKDNAREKRKALIEKRDVLLEKMKNQKKLIAKAEREEKASKTKKTKKKSLKKNRNKKDD